MEDKIGEIHDMVSKASKDLSTQLPLKLLQLKLIIGSIFYVKN